MSITVRFVEEKKTKNAVRYKEVPETGQEEVIGSLYLKKGAAESIGPDVKVTVSKA